MGDPTDDPTDTFQGAYDKWLSMANQYIDQLDPFKRALPFEGSPSNNEE